MSSLCLFVSCALVGQARQADSLSSRLRPVINVGLSTSALGLPVWLQAGVANARHVGLLGLGSDYPSDTEPWMFAALYQYFPNPPGRRFDVFFQLEAELGKRKEKRWQTGLYGGYGLSIRIGKRAFFRTNYGLGYLLGKESHGQAGSPLKLSGNFRIGFGRRF